MSGYSKKSWLKICENTFSHKFLANYIMHQRTFAVTIKPWIPFAFWHRTADSCSQFDPVHAISPLLWVAVGKYQSRHLSDIKKTCYFMSVLEATKSMSPVVDKYINF